MCIFSIIVPIYGVEKYLGTCIESVLNQTFSDFELILVNDGSKDRCHEICSEYKNKDIRIKYIKKENSGLVSARKAGAEVAKGKYVICLDGDDWIPDKCLEVYHKIFEKYNPDLICGAYQKVYDDKFEKVENIMPQGLHDRKEIQKNIFPMLIESNSGIYYSPMVWAKAYKRELYVPIQLKVDNRIKIGEDHACTRPYLFNCNSLYITKQITYNYRINPYSMTRERKAFNWNDPQIIYDVLKKSIDIYQYDFKKQINRYIVHNLFNISVSQFYKKEKYFVIKEDIAQHLNLCEYKDAINNCVFKNSFRGKMAQFCLKNRLYFVMLVWAKFKRR